MVIGANCFISLCLWWTESDSDVAFTGIRIGQTFIGLAWG